LEAAQGLHGLAAAHGLQGFAAAQGLQGLLAAHGLHGFSAAHGLLGRHGKQAANQLAGITPSFTPAASAPATPSAATITITTVLTGFFLAGGLPPPFSVCGSMARSLFPVAL